MVPFFVQIDLDLVSKVVVLKAPDNPWLSDTQGVLLICESGRYCLSSTELERALQVKPSLAQLIEWG